jgi:nucleoside-diphosphate-sugar epimerase
MIVTVTGCAGFIGSRLAARLLEDGCEVQGIDAFTPYYSRASKEANIVKLRGNKRFNFLQADLRTDSLETLAQADVVFHLAAQPGVRASWGSGFSQYVGHNIVATQRLLEACLAGGTGRFVYASSSSVYGDAETLPTHEDARCQPISPYGATKLAAEHLIEAYAASFGLNAVMLRYFTVYGPGQRPDMGFHRFIRAVLEDRKIEVYGDGLQTRDVTYVDDVVEATIAAGTAPMANGAINVGGGSRVSVNEAIRLIGEALQREPTTVYVDPAAGDVRDTGADLTRARELLGYQPRIGVGEGLANEVAWLAAQYQPAP